MGHYDKQRLRAAKTKECVKCSKLKLTKNFRARERKSGVTYVAGVCNQCLGSSTQLQLSKIDVMANNYISGSKNWSVNGYAN